MARPKQDGLFYFSFDTDFFYADKRIKRLQSKFGNDGLIFYIYMLTEIYRNGYYISWNEESAEDAAADLWFQGRVYRAGFGILAWSVTTHDEQTVYGGHYHYFTGNTETLSGGEKRL